MTSCFGGRRGNASEQQHVTANGRPAVLQLEGPLAVFAAGCAPGVESGRQRLSPLDHSTILTCLNPKALFFTYHLDPRMLRTALSIVLRDYPSLCGRMMAPGNAVSGVSGLDHGILKARREQGFWVVYCNAGVTVRVARAPHWSMNTTFASLSSMCRTGFSSGRRQARPDLPPWFEPMDLVALLNGRSAPLAVRITQLGCGGTVLGVTLAHAVTDGRSACMFLRAWAAVYRQITAAGPAPSPLSARVELRAGAQGEPRQQQLHHTRSAASAAVTQGGLFPRQQLYIPSHQVPEPPSNARHLLLMGSNPLAGSGNVPGPQPRRVVEKPWQVDVHVTADGAGTQATPALASLAAHPGDPIVTPQMPGISAQSGLQVWGNRQAVQVQHTTPLPRAPSDPRSSVMAPAQDVQHAASQWVASEHVDADAQLLTHITLPSYLTLQALPQQPAGWRSAIQIMLQAYAAIKQEAAQWPGFDDDLSTSIIHVPADTVQHLKALCSSGQQHVSTNDCLTALVWVLVCELRGRPLPGAVPPGAVNALGMAVDMRMNGLKDVLPSNLYANATWAVHVPSDMHAVQDCQPGCEMAPQSVQPTAVTASAQRLPVTPTPSVNSCDLKQHTQLGASGDDSPLQQEEQQACPATALSVAGSVEGGSVQGGSVQGGSVQGRSVQGGSVQGGPHSQDAGAILGLRSRQMSEPPPMQLLSQLTTAAVQRLLPVPPPALPSTDQPTQQVVRTLEEAWKYAQAAARQPQSEQHLVANRFLYPSRQLSRSCSAAAGMLWRQGSEPGPCGMVSRPIGEMTETISGGDVSRWEGAVRFGAASVRAAILELRKQSPECAASRECDSQQMSKGLATHGREEEGWRVVEHAAQLSAAPVPAQLHVAARVVLGQDVMVTSWGQFPYWDVDFGQGGPARMLGLLTPTPPWAAAIQAAHPSDGGFYITLASPTAAVPKLATAGRMCSVLNALAPGCQVHVATSSS